MKVCHLIPHFFGDTLYITDLNRSLIVTSALFLSRQQTVMGLQRTCCAGLAFNQITEMRGVGYNTVYEKKKTVFKSGIHSEHGYNEFFSLLSIRINHLLNFLLVLLLFNFILYSSRFRTCYILRPISCYILFLSIIIPSYHILASNQKEQNIYWRGIYQKKSVVLYCFHTAGVLHIFMLYNLLGPGISFYRKSKIIVKRKPNYEIVWFHN